MTISRFRGLCAGLILCSGLGLSPLVANAHTARPLTVKSTVKTSIFQGRVTDVIGGAASPTSFTIVTRAGRLLEFRVLPSTRFHALSAEAEVQGFLTGDFVLIEADRINRDWVATDIRYDVAPLPQFRTLAGVIMRVAPDDSRFFVRLDTGGSRWFAVAPGAKIRLNGAAAGPAALVKGSAVAVTMQKVDRDWVVVEIDVLSPGHALGT